MTLGSILSQAKAQTRQTSTDLDDFIKDNVNLAYVEMTRRGQWPGLTVDDEEFTTDSDDRGYHLPYPLTEIVRDSLRYDVTDTVPGTPIGLTGNDVTQLYRGYSTSAPPLSAAIAAGTGTDLYNTGTVAVTNRSATVTGSGTTWTTADHAGQWIVFHADSDGNDGKDYGYKILTRNSATSLTLTEPYRGPTLSAARYSIRPGSTKRLLFTPAFTETAKTVVYAWRRKPRRLYNEEDMPEVEALGEALLYRAMAHLAAYDNRADQATLWFSQARIAYANAVRETIP